MEGRGEAAEARDGVQRNGKERNGSKGSSDGP